MKEAQTDGQNNATITTAVNTAGGLLCYKSNKTLWDVLL